LAANAFKQSPMLALPIQYPAYEWKSGVFAASVPALMPAQRKTMAFGPHRDAASARPASLVLPHKRAASAKRQSPKNLGYTDKPIDYHLHRSKDISRKEIE
jgi:hypothetical protein